MSISCSDYLTRHFIHLVTKGFNILSGFFHELHFFKGFDKRANNGRVDMLLILDNGAENLRNGGIIPEVFFYSLPKFKRDGREHIFSAPSKIVAVEFAYR